jgi:hypothetical protein
MVARPGRRRSRIQEAAEFLNFNNIDMVCLQHEYGIFGGPAGSHILHLLRGLKMPVVTTLHTVLREPNPDQLMVMEEIAELSDRLIVMSQLSSQFLQEIFKVPGSKIDMVPHGVPDLPFLDPNFYKDRFGVEGKAVLLTFGLLSPNKGIENVIQALPQILSKHKNVVYIVAGATHPHILRREGDKYRASLQALAKEVGVESQVIFHDRFVSPEEMAEFIGAADIYITPYRYEEQVVSGTLAYALGRARQSSRLPIGTRLSCWTTAGARWFRSKIPMRSRKNDRTSGHTRDSPCHAQTRLSFARTWSGKKSRKGTWRVSSRVRSDRMENPRVQFSARATPQSARSTAGIETGSCECADRRHGNFAARDLYHSQSGEGHTTDDNARALIFTVMLEQLNKDGAGRKQTYWLRICLPGICRFWNMRSIQRTADSGTFSATIVAGTNR